MQLFTSILSVRSSTTNKSQHSTTQHSTQHRVKVHCFTGAKRVCHLCSGYCLSCQQMQRDYIHSQNAIAGNLHRAAVKLAMPCRWLYLKSKSIWLICVKHTEMKETFLKNELEISTKLSKKISTYNFTHFQTRHELHDVCMKFWHFDCWSARCYARCNHLFTIKCFGLPLIYQLFYNVRAEWKRKIVQLCADENVRFSCSRQWNDAILSESTRPSNQSVWQVVTQGKL